jgi:hypothetical protein
MPKKKTKNINNNFRGKEDAFWKNISEGMKNFLKSPWKK